MMRYGKTMRLLLMSLFAALVLNPAVAMVATAELEITLKPEDVEVSEDVDMPGLSEGQVDVVVPDDGMALEDIPDLEDIIDLDDLGDLEDLFDMSDLADLDPGKEVAPEPDHDDPPEYDMEVVKAYLTSYLSSKTTGYSMVQRLAKAWDSSHAEYLRREAQYRKGVATYKQGKKDYEAGVKVYEEGKQRYCDFLSVAKTAQLHGMGPLAAASAVFGSKGC